MWTCWQSALFYFICSFVQRIKKTIIFKKVIFSLFLLVKFETIKISRFENQLFLEFPLNLEILIGQNEKVKLNLNLNSNKQLYLVQGSHISLTLSIKYHMLCVSQSASNCHMFFIVLICVSVWYAYIHVCHSHFLHFTICKNKNRNRIRKQCFAPAKRTLCRERKSETGNWKIKLGNWSENQSKQ